MQMIHVQNVSFLGRKIWNAIVCPLFWRECPGMSQTTRPLKSSLSRGILNPLWILIELLIMPINLTCRAYNIQLTCHWYSWPTCAKDCPDVQVPSHYIIIESGRVYVALRWDHKFRLLQGFLKRLEENVSKAMLLYPSGHTTSGHFCRPKRFRGTWGLEVFKGLDINALISAFGSHSFQLCPWPWHSRFARGWGFSLLSSSHNYN